jgi:hypothetical protein
VEALVVVIRVSAEMVAILIQLVQVNAVVNAHVILANVEMVVVQIQHVVLILHVVATVEYVIIVVVIHHVNVMETIVQMIVPQMEFINFNVYGYNKVFK